MACSIQKLLSGVVVLHLEHVGMLRASYVEFRVTRTVCLHKYRKKSRTPWGGYNPADLAPLVSEGIHLIDAACLHLLETGILCSICLTLHITCCLSGNYVLSSITSVLPYDVAYCCCARHCNRLLNCFAYTQGCNVFIPGPGTASAHGLMQDTADSRLN